MITSTHDHTDRCWWNPDQARWNCRPASETESATESATAIDAVEPNAETRRPLIDVRDMILVHAAMLREFRLAPAAVDAVADGDLRRAKVVDRHLGFVGEMLHHHHQGEDDLLWPLLRARVPAAALPFLDDVEAQHVQIDAALTAVTQGRAAWTHDASATHRDQLSAASRTLYAVLSEHLDLEERSVLPLAAGLVSEAEWHAIGEAAVAATPKSVLPLTFGMFAYEGDPEVLRSMLAAAPALPRMLLPRIAPRVYARRARQVYGALPKVAVA